MAVLPDPASTASLHPRVGSPTRVLASIDSPAGDHCVDIFQRDDGTYGYEEYRRDPEDMKGWFPLHRYSSLVFPTDQEALAGAKATIAWMAVDSP